MHLNLNHSGNQREKEETAVRQMEELYRRAIAGAGAVPYASDFKTRSYLFIGEGIEQLIGYPAHEITHELWPRIIQESVMLGDAAGLTKEEAGQQVLAGRLRNWRCDMRVLTRSGESRWISDASVQNFDATGQPIGAVGILQDITERKRAEDERNRLFNLSLDMMCVAGFDGCLKQVNPAWSTCLGWTAEELTSRPMNDFVLPEDHEATQRIREKIHQGQTVRGFENRYRCKDGSYRWLSWNVHPWIVSRQVFAVARDVTQHKQAEEKLAQQAALLDEAREAIFVIDLNDQITFWNHGAERIFGWKSAEATGKKSCELFQLQKAPFEEAMRLLFENGHWQGDLKKKTKSGRELIMETRWTLVRDEHGKPHCILAINTDVTEKKKLEAQFLRTQRMESIGTLAGGIAHDLNNVLAPILMSIEILKMSFPDEDSKKLLNTVQASAERGSDLVKQVLSFARGVEGERVIVNPLHLMRELLKVMRDTFPKSINVQFTPAPDLWTVNGDATQLHQVFLNLCVNARDAMPHGGDIRVTMENVVLDDTYAAMNPDSSPGAYVHVKVSDTGSGIPPGIQDKIFEPFFTTKEIGKGTGLGLSTTLAIVKSHGGFINLYSEVGKGATFQVYLPANTTEVAADKSAGEQNILPRGNGELVLVVDDEESIRRVAQKTLERFGYKVMLASNGAEAVSLYAQNREQIAVVLTDMAMPIMDGPALIIALKAMNPNVRIIGSSGLSTSGGVTRAVGTGIEHFVPKPYTAEAMLTVLKKVLGENSPA